jgi:atypical dual specificity phosphatase
MADGDSCAAGDCVATGTAAVVVRPRGYVEPEPVIRRIGDRDLFLGNEHAADPSRHDRTFDAVLSVSSDSYPATTHHRPLTDSADAEWQSFADAVETGRELVVESGSLLIHCRAGISRSTAVLATTLAAVDDRPFRDALETVLDARPAAMPHPRLHELGVLYLAARG